jgi:hypothetical protein
MRIVDEKILDEFRGPGKCEWCGYVTRWKRDPHHLWTRGMGGGGRLDIRINLISLCRLCHDAVGLGHIARCDLLAVVASRESTTQSQIEEEIWRLRRTPK